MPKEHHMTDSLARFNYGLFSFELKGLTRDLYFLVFAKYDDRMTHALQVLDSRDEPSVAADFLLEPPNFYTSAEDLLALREMMLWLTVEIPKHYPDPV